MELVNEKILIELGSLQVYEVQTLIDGKIYRGTYWKDAGSPQGYGPFLDAYTAVKHYETLIKSMKKDKALDDKTAEIIRVDFVKRCKVTI